MLIHIIEVLLVLVLITTTVTYLIRRRLKTKRIILTTQVKDLITRATAGDEGAWEELSKLREAYFSVGWLLDTSLHSDYQSAYREIGYIRSYGALLPKFRVALKAALDARGQDGEAEMVADFLRMLTKEGDVLSRAYGKGLTFGLEKDLKFSTADYKTRLQELITQKYDQLVISAESSDESYGQLRDLIKSTRYRWGSNGSLYTHVDQLNYPPSWHGLVAKWVKNPNLADFADLMDPGQVPHGSVRLMAAQALLDNSYTVAKVVLAYCNAPSRGNWVTVEVGGLAAQLALLVEEHDRMASTS